MVHSLDLWLLERAWDEYTRNGITAHFVLLLGLQGFFFYIAYIVGRSWTVCFSLLEAFDDLPFLVFF